MKTEQLIVDFKNAIQKQDLEFDECCFIFDQDLEDKCRIAEVVEDDTEIKIFYDEDWSISTMTIEELWTQFCAVDSSKPCVFIHNETGERKKFLCVDDCLGTTIDFNVESETAMMNDLRTEITRAINRVHPDNLAQICTVVVGKPMVDMIACDAESVIDMLEGTIEHSTDEFIIKCYDELKQMGIVNEL